MVGRQRPTASTPGRKATVPMAETLTARHVDPRTLLTDRNVRTDVRLDKQFVASLREFGVLMPIVAVNSPAGLRVRYGQRRTLGAIAADLDTVHVVVLGEEDSCDATEIHRVLTQYHENVSRAGLTTSEEVEVYAQLHAFGISAHIQPYCTDWKANGHTDTRASHNANQTATSSAEDKEAAKKARRLVIDNNKAWETAMTPDANG